MTNKKWVLIFMSLILVIALAACGNKEEPAEEPEAQPPIQEEPVEEAGEDEKLAIMGEFKSMVEEEKASAEIIKTFIDENLPALGELEGSQMLHSLETALKREIGDVNRDLQEFDQDQELINLMGEELELNSEMLDEIESEELKAVVKSARDRHYKLIRKDGKVEAAIDYSSLKVYEEKVSHEWREYLEIMATNSDSPPVYDEALLISFDELGERILRIENYLNRYIDGPRQDELLELYESNLVVYYKGLPNTPIASYDSGIIMGNIYISYENIAANDGYVTSGMINEYMIAIRDNDMIIDEKILLLADEYIDESVRVLKEFK